MGGSNGLALGIVEEMVGLRRKWEGSQIVGLPVARLGMPSEGFEGEIFKLRENDERDKRIECEGEW